MQRTYTLELRVDYADPGKKEPMQEAVRRAGAHLLATANLICDSGTKPQIAGWADDYFDGHEEISILPDTIAQGLQQIGAPEGDTMEGVSDELLAAVKEMNNDG